MNSGVTSFVFFFTFSFSDLKIFVISICLYGEYGCCMRKNAIEPHIVNTSKHSFQKYKRTELHADAQV